MNTETYCNLHPCKLIKFRVWKDEETISGFQAVFSYPPLTVEMCADEDKYLSVQQYDSRCCWHVLNPDYCPHTGLNFVPNRDCCSCGGGTGTTLHTEVRRHVQDFGTKGLASGFEEITIDEEITGIGFRFDP